MQQVETLVCCADRKIACETLVAGNAESTFPANLDFPVECFRIPIDQEQLWVNNTNSFLCRKPSTKDHHHQQQQPKSHSQRMSLNKIKSSIFGLPGIQNSPLWSSKFRPARFHFFPKRNLNQNRSSGDDHSPEIEPISPRVSCMGRVKLKDKKKKKTKKKKKKKKGSEESPEIAGSSGMWVRFVGFLRMGCDEKESVDCVERTPEKSLKRRFFVEESVEPPGLSGLKRFTSGRKAASMGSVLEFMEFESAAIGEGESGVRYEMDLHRPAMLPGVGKFPQVLDGGFRRRHTGVTPESVDCVRDWVKVGPALA